MSITETDRIELHNQLVEAIGPVATKLMQHIPPDWTQLATKSDLAALGTELRGEMKAMEGRIARRFGIIDGRFGKIEGQFGKIEGQFERLRGEMKAMEGRIAGQIAKFSLTVVLALLGLVVALVVSGALGAA
ncbi:MAG: hypothetical protein OXG18_07090 [Gemmatimonadetes bacterium]|nr:hypothetical protein [Gemmatimonadota bacterium]